MHDRLVEAAIDLFYRQGFMATSVRQVTAAVGVTPGALYNHFVSKEALLEAVILAAHEELLGLLRGAVAQATTPDDRLRAFVEAYVLFYARSPTRSRVSIRDMDFLPPASFEAVVVFRRQTRRLLEDILEAGAATAGFRLLDAGGMPASRASAMAIMDMCVMVTEPYWLDVTLSPQEVADVHARLALRMVAAAE